MQITVIAAGPAGLLLGYLLGSIPFGVVITRAAGAGDVRRIGSGNIGATNVLRTGRKDLALATLLLDAGKGAVALLLARHLLNSETAGAIRALDKAVALFRVKPLNGSLCHGVQSFS